MVLSTEVTVLTRYCRIRSNIPSYADCVLHNSRGRCSHSGPFRLEWFSRCIDSKIAWEEKWPFLIHTGRHLGSFKAGCSYTGGLHSFSIGPDLGCACPHGTPVWNLSSHWPEMQAGILIDHSYLKSSGLVFAQYEINAELSHRHTEDFTQQKTKFTCCYHQLGG